ncbi:hypothetical protein [Peribacillus sp. NPDC058002]|uniref:hypothetical protein n=1 Tax=Peribacillus sp. NPDC058002 TaxID=3346301 RepID=UPI0036D8F69D
MDPRYEGGKQGLKLGQDLVDLLRNKVKNGFATSLLKLILHTDHAPYLKFQPIYREAEEEAKKATVGAIRLIL